MAPIVPKFDINLFGDLIAGDGQNHASSSDTENILRPQLFNEYERVMVLVTDTLGDTAYSELYSGLLGYYQGQPYTFQSVPETLYDVLVLLKQLGETLWEDKYAVSGGEITGKVTVSETLSAEGIKTTWTTARTYAPGTIVAAPDGKFYVCKTQHQSTSFSSDAPNWELLTYVGSDHFLITVPEEYHYTFEPGDCIYYDSSGFTPAIATEMSTLATMVVVKQVSSMRYEVATGGIIDFGVNVFPSAGTYYLSDTVPGKVTRTKPNLAQQVYQAIGTTTAVVVLNRYNAGTYIQVDSFSPSYSGEGSFILSHAPASEEFVFVTINGILQEPATYTVSGNVIAFDQSGGTIGPEDTITVRYFYGDGFTSFEVVMDGYTVGNSSGEVPLNNGALNMNLNADRVDGYHAGNASGNIPVSNGTLNVNLNADKVDGYHASTTSTASTIPVSGTDGKLDLAWIKQGSGSGLNADQVDGYHAGNASGYIPVNNGVTNINLNADMVDGYHSTDIVPIGGIIMYAGGSKTDPAPTLNNFLYCDGSAISRTTYSNLFNVIGTTFGAGNGSTTFNIPNLKGVVPRGMGQQAINGRTKDGSTLGALLEDRIQQMTGYFRSTYLGLEAYGGVLTYAGSISKRCDAGGSTSYYNGVGFDASRVARTGDYTRDNSLSVRFYIRYK